MGGWGNVGACMWLALAFSESGEILQPMGVAVFFGLTTSTFLTLFLIPCLIRLADHWSSFSSEVVE